MEIAKQANISYERENGRVHSFFALKFHDGEEDLKKVEAIEKALNKAGIDITLMARDVEKWGKAEIPENKKLMPDYAFPAMNKCDCNIIEFSEKGVGLGINAGYCFANNKPIYVIAKTGSDISTTISNLATKIIFYDEPEDLIEPFKEIVNNFPRVILASKSVVRKQMMIDESIPFEVIVSNADETADKTKSFESQLAEISMKKANKVFEETQNRGLRLIVAGDQNIVFENKLYEKPKTLKEAKLNIKSMAGSDNVFAYTGNTVLLANKDRILQSINITDVARMSMDDVDDEEIEKYINSRNVLKYCGGFSITDCTFLHLKEGRMSTAKGLTIEYAKEMMKQLR